MAKKLLFTALLSDRDADRVLKSLPKETIKWTEEVETERLIAPEHSMGAGKRAGGQISLQLREAARARSQSNQV